MKKLLIYILINILLLSCSSESSSGEQRREVNLPSNEIWDMDMDFTRKGELIAKVNAHYVMRDEVVREIYISYLDSGVVIYFYDDGEQAGKLTSNKGIYDERRDMITAQEDVVLHHPNGSKLYTDTLYFNTEKDLVYTDHYFRFISDRDTTMGKSFKSSSSFDSYEIEEFSGRTEDFESFKRKFED